MGKFHTFRTVVNTFERILDSEYKLPEEFRGRPRLSRRRVVFGILYICLTGVPWRRLPKRYGSKSAVHGYFSRWAVEGLFQRLHMELLIVGVSLQGFDLSDLLLDASARPNQLLP